MGPRSWGRWTWQPEVACRGLPAGAAAVRSRGRFHSPVHARRPATGGWTAGPACRRGSPSQPQHGARAGLRDHGGTTVRQSRCSALDEAGGSPHAAYLIAGRTGLADSDAQGSGAARLVCVIWCGGGSRTLRRREPHVVLSRTRAGRFVASSQMPSRKGAQIGLLRGTPKVHSPSREAEDGRYRQRRQVGGARWGAGGPG